MDVNKVINTLSLRFADNVARLEKELVIANLQNQELKEEIEQLKAEKTEEKPSKKEKATKNKEVH